MILPIHVAQLPIMTVRCVRESHILYYFVQFVCHTSHPDLSEKLLITCIYELNEMVQYLAARS
jgi:hypothetical protein